MAAPGGWRRLIVATVAFLFFAPPTLAALPLAALLVLAGPGTPRAWLVAGGLAAASGAVLEQLGEPLRAAYGAWSVLLAAAFAGGILLAPRPFWQQAVRATALAAVAFAGLGRAMWGPSWLSGLSWEVRRLMDEATRVPLWLEPDVGPVREAMAAFAGATVPATLLLQGLAGLTLAWAWHGRLAAAPLGEPLRPLREFRLGDAWIWGLVVAIGAGLLGRSGVAQNLALVLGTLYVLQGLGIVTAVATVAGVSMVALVAAAVVATVLIVPLLFILPGLVTLGVTDTWLRYRQRLAARSGGAGPAA
jgi:hypothetical protein